MHGFKGGSFARRSTQDFLKGLPRIKRYNCGQTELMIHSTAEGAIP
jgi:hypothetical protein